MASLLIGAACMAVSAFLTARSRSTVDLLNRGETVARRSAAFSFEPVDDKCSRRAPAEELLHPLAFSNMASRWRSENKYFRTLFHAAAQAGREGNVIDLGCTKHCNVIHAATANAILGWGCYIAADFAMILPQRTEIIGEWTEEYNLADRMWAHILSDHARSDHLVMFGVRTGAQTSAGALEVAARHLEADKEHGNFGRTLVAQTKLGCHKTLAARRVATLVSIAIEDAARNERATQGSETTGSDDNATEVPMSIDSYWLTSVAESSAAEVVEQIEGREQRRLGEAVRGDRQMREQVNGAEASHSVGRSLAKIHSGLTGRYKH